MSKETANLNWLVINTVKGNRIECLRCGAFQVLERSDILVWGQTSAEFAKAHGGCEPHPNGNVCTYCSLRGHAPSDCALLHPKSPAEWLAGPDTGASSRVIFAVLARRPDVYTYFGGKPLASVPYDHGDFGRCYRLLRCADGWTERLAEVAVAHPEWAPFIAAWPELSRLYEEEVPTGSAPKLYARIDQLLRGTR
jgi:hypothetical protein